MPPVVRFSGFGKVYREVVAVRELSFTVGQGRILGLLGPNGAGKSTALRGLLGLLRPTAGSATVFGRPYGELSTPARRVGAHLDGVGFEPGISGRGHLRICAAAAGASRQRVERLLAEVGLRAAANRRVGRYSAGMTQRLGLATALVGDPELLVLDEPANGLDPDGIRWLRRFLREFADGGGTVLLSSHQLAEVAQTIDDVVIIKGGLLFAGSLAELTDGGRHELEQRYFDLIDRAGEPA
ncbi:ABC transporter ATP-binding protein [Crossiella cryophila]|uniref:ABC-2 type transport system ATP-binding protein n=1 Tax=Crossiella cryophila TaxID=43355 RepID=A0A7W7FWX7_9PSEU|nr:ATP-binding cassette domain-containing protein [Crossiella cryophila]MBB4678369.1 ABC-2 type transport system ATP-binding protein [Crossiella cryophila]